MYPWDLIDEILILYQESLWRKSSDPIFFLCINNIFWNGNKKKEDRF